MKRQESRVKRQIVLLTLALAATSGVATATDYDWLSGTGDWTDTGWTTNGIVVTPAWDASSVGIIHSGTQNLTPTANPGTQINEVRVKPGAGTANLNISGDLSLAGRLQIGSDSSDSGSVTVTQTDGAVTLAGSAFVGQYGSGANTYHLNGGSLNSYRLYVAANDTASATVNIGGGAISLSDSLHVGQGVDNTGELNLSSGSLQVTADWAYIGVSGTGALNQTGGALSLQRVGIGYYSGSDGTVSVSGGSFTASNYIYGRYGDSLFVVDGSGATEIEVNAVIFNNDSDTLRFNLDAGGSTRMDASGDYNGLGINLQNSTVEIDAIAGFNGTVGSTYDLMWTASGFDTTGLTLSNLCGTEFDWDIVSKDGGEVFQVTVIPEPGTLGLVVAMGGGLLFIRRKFMI